MKIFNYYVAVFHVFGFGFVAVCMQSINVSTLLAYTNHDCKIYNLLIYSTDCLLKFVWPIYTMPADGLAKSFIYGFVSHSSIHMGWQ